MRKLVLLSLLFVLIFPAVTFAEDKKPASTGELTLEETLEYIKDKFNKYTYQEWGVEILLGEMFIANNKLYIKWYYKHLLEYDYKTIERKITIPLNMIDINRIYSINGTVNLNIKYNQELIEIYSKDMKGKTYTRKDYDYDFKFSDDIIADRVEKAFTHLAKLCGAISPKDEADPFN